MAVDKLVDSSKLNNALAATADAIRAKTGGSADIAFDYSNETGFADAVSDIPTGGGGNDFIVNLSYNSSTDIWSPDCTYAELQAAYSAGKSIATLALDPETGWPLQSSICYDEITGGFSYSVVYYYYFSSLDVNGVRKHYFIFTSSGVTDDGYEDLGELITISPLSVTANGTYTAPSGAAYSPVTVNVSGGGQPSASPSDVNFIDYDGSVLYSYTEADALALTDLPANPSHSGLTAQGWNWTLAQIKAQLTAMPGAPVWVGQMYITDDGKTRIYCRFETGRLAPYLGLGVNGTVTVDWGDGSSTDTLTGTSLATAKTVQHTYSAAGDYTITLTVMSGSFAFFGVSNIAHILKKSTATTANVNRVYANAVQRVEMGANASIENYAFYYCSSLASITIPDGVTSIGDNAFYYCYSLASITIPDGVTSIGSTVVRSCSSLTSITIPDSVTSIGDNAFQYCYSLASITIPDGMTSIGSTAFSNCSSLASITIPDGVTRINSNTFQNCYGLGEMHFLPTTPPTVSSTNAFSGVQTDCKIYVPAGSLAAYTSATNYPSSSTYTYIEE